MVMLFFAVELKKVRLETRKTQREFAEMCGVNPFTIKAWETGRSVPNYMNFDAICNQLNRMKISTVDLNRAYEICKLRTVLPSNNEGEK